MKLKTVLFAALLTLSGSVLAANPPSATTGAQPMGHREGPCKTDPAKCQAAAAKFDQWCSANAEKCTDLKAWAERRREFCEANKQKCEEHRQKMHERMANWCQQDPDKAHCKAMRAEPGNDQESDDQVPPPHA